MKNEKLLKAMFRCSRKKGENVIAGLNYAYYNDKVISVPEGAAVIGDGYVRFMYTCEYDSETNKIIAENNVETVILPDGIKEISARAFDGLWRLKRIFIPKTVEVIGDEAFQSCKSCTIYCEDKPKAGWIDKEPESELHIYQGGTVYEESIRTYNNWNPCRRPVVTGVTREEFLKMINEENG